MMDGAPASGHEAVRAAAVAYCEGLHNADAAAFEAMCHERFLMTTVAGSGKPVFWDKASFVARIAGRKAFDGTPDFEIMTIDVAGDMAHVKLRVSVPPRRYEDYLGFFHVDGTWQLINKLFRTIDGPPLEG
jgi:hypothetical protein